MTRGCYAQILEDCDGGPLSREHYISLAVLRKLGSTAIAGGFKWIKGEESKPVDNFAAKILCKRHNSSLSLLDNEAARLFGVLDSDRLTGPQEHVLFSGIDIERWMLKVLVGLLASGCVEGVTGSKANDNWVRILFGEKDMPPKWGLYLFDRLPGDDPSKGAIDIVIGESDKRFGPDGITLGLLGFRFRLQLLEPPRMYPRRLIPRPRQMSMKGWLLEFAWPQATFNKRVNILDRK